MDLAFESVHQSFLREVSTPRLARFFVTAALEANGATSLAIESFQLATSELVSNVVEHGTGQYLDVEVVVGDPRCWELIVVGVLATEHSPLPRTHLWEVAGPHEASGRGLGIVRQLMDEVSTSLSGSSLAVRCSLNRVNGHIAGR
jgi:anti-sigma regulatory factor (Ser/Thr protein kinase)